MPYNLKSKLVLYLSTIVVVCLVGLLSAQSEFELHIPKKEVSLQNLPSEELNGFYKWYRDHVRPTEQNESIGAALEMLENKVDEVEGPIKAEAIKTIGYLKIRNNDIIGAQSKFQQIVRGDVPSSDATYADAKIRLGYLKYKQGDRKGALKEFGDIAKGLIKADNEIATDASLRFASLLRTEKRAVESIEAYTQIASKADKVEDQLYAKLQIAGLLWESGKGDYGDADDQHFHDSREVAREVMNHPDVIPQTQAIAELIYLEDFYFLGDYQIALELAEVYVEKWFKYRDENPDDAWDPGRQIVTAQSWLAFCLYRTGNYEECIRVCQIIRSGLWSDSVPYKNFNVFGYSLIYEAFSEEALSNTEKGKRLRTEAQEKFPGWYDAVIESVEYKLGLRE